MATDAVNRAIRDKIANVDYNQLIIVQKDNQGQIVLMQPNIVRINQLASDTTLSIQSALQGLASEQFNIPLARCWEVNCWQTTAPGPGLHLPDRNRPHQRFRQI